jgi:hypothetical protein
VTRVRRDFSADSIVPTLADASLEHQIHALTRPLDQPATGERFRYPPVAGRLTARSLSLPVFSPGCGDSRILVSWKP